MVLKILKLNEIIIATVANDTVTTVSFITTIFLYFYICNLPVISRKSDSKTSIVNPWQISKVREHSYCCFRLDGFDSHASAYCKLKVNTMLYITTIRKNTVRNISLKM